MPNFMLYDEIFLFFLNLHMDLWNSTLGELPRFDKVSSINHDKDGKNVISLFKQDVFAIVAIVGSYGPFLHLVFTCGIILSPN